MIAQSPRIQTLGGGWTPARLTLDFRLVGGVGWYQDLAAATPAVTTSDPVRLWQDQSGNGRDFTAAADNVRPTVKLNPSRYKGRPSLAFSGGLGQYLRNAAYAGMSGASAYTLVAFFKAGVSGSQPILGTAGGCYLDQGGNTFFAQSNGNSSVGGSFAWNHTSAKVAILRYDGSATGNADRLRLRGNRIDRTLNFNGTTVAATLPALTGVYLGRFPAGLTGLDGEVFEAFGLPRALTDAECDLVDSYAGRAYFSEGLSQVQCPGDSLTSGYPDHTNDGLDWVTKLGAALGSNWTALNQGHATFTCAQIQAVVTGTTVINRDEWRTRDVALVNGGSNDFSPTTNDFSVDAVMANMVAIVNALHASGQLAYVATVPPTGGLSNTAGDMLTFNARRAEYRTRLLAGESGADGIIDWSGDPRLAEPRDSRYFNSGDLVHFTAGGNDVIAYLAYPFAAGGGSTTNPGTPAAVPPAVFTQPGNTSVAEGEDAEFFADATGGPYPSVRWRLSTDGGSSYADMPGETSTTLTLPAATAGQDSYKYRARFTNGAGAADSNPATLTVTSGVTTLALDHYTAADGTAPTARPPDTGPTPAAPAGGAFEIQSDRLCETDGVNGLLLYSVGQADVTVSVTLAVNATNNSGVVVRSGPSGADYLLFSITGNLYKFASSSLTGTLASGPLTTADGSVLSVECSGNSIVCKHNGVQVCAATLAGADITTYGAATRFGVKTNADTTVRFDDLTITSP